MTQTTLKECPNKGSPCMCDGTCKEPVGYEKSKSIYEAHKNTRPQVTNKDADDYSNCNLPETINVWGNGLNQLSGFWDNGKKGYIYTSQALTQSPVDVENAALFFLRNRNKDVSFVEEEMTKTLINCYVSEVVFEFAKHLASQGYITTPRHEANKREQEIIEVMKMMREAAILAKAEMEFELQEGGHDPSVGINASKLIHAIDCTQKALAACDEVLRTNAVRSDTASVGGE